MDTQSKAKIKERAALLVSIEKTLPARFLLDQDKFPTWVHALARCVTTLYCIIASLRILNNCQLYSSSSSLCC
jgi:hypothetical protein